MSTCNFISHSRASNHIFVSSVLAMEFTLSQQSLLLCDNLGATHLSFNPVQHSRMKHIQIDIHFVRDLVEKKILTVRHVHTTDQLVDLLTKPLSRQRINYLRDKIGLSDGSPFLRGRIKETQAVTPVHVQDQVGTMNSRIDAFPLQSLTVVIKALRYNSSLSVHTLQL